MTVPDPEELDALARLAQAHPEDWPLAAGRMARQVLALVERVQQLEAALTSIRLEVDASRPLRPGDPSMLTGVRTSAIQALQRVDWLAEHALAGQPAQPPAPDEA